MRMQEITKEQYLALLKSGGDAVCTNGRLNESEEEFLLAAPTLDGKYDEGCWERWANGKAYTYFYAAVE